MARHRSGGLLFLRQPERSWPAAVGVNHIVDLGHEADGFGQGDDDFVVVDDVVRGEGPPFAVLEPFLADLVAADKATSRSATPWSGPQCPAVRPRTGRLDWGR